MVNVGVEYAKYSTIPVGVGIFVLIWCQDDEVGVSSARVERILISPKIVGGIVDAEDFVAVDSIVLNDGCVSFI